MEPKLYTVEDVARILKKHPDTIRRLIRQKKIPARKIGGTWYVSEETLRRLMSEESNEG
ncbi:MAG: helix-turn-helix domain-containing protein [Chloroflexi bacterium]|nr:MAG: helix-turn-helix domain-containing protein [Chloroflexota bacterium]